MADPQFNEAGWAWLLAQHEHIRDLLKEASKPSGSQVMQAAQKILDILDNIDQIVSDSIARTSYSAQQIDAKDSSTLSSAVSSAKSYTDGVAAGKENSFGVLPAAKGGTNTGNGYNNLFSSGPCRAAWLLSDGTLGTSQSSRTVKTDFHEPGITLEQLRSVDWTGYRYIDDVNANSDSALPRIGMIAEDLDDAGLGIFVVYDDDTLEPVGVDYATLSVAAMHMARLAHDRLDDLEARISNLEAKESQ